MEQKSSDSLPAVLMDIRFGASFIEAVKLVWDENRQHSLQRT
jgi:hypothetical protein